jgi:uncharacterized protein (DUF4415 family)
MKINTGKLEREIDALMHLRDDQIDTADIPEVTNWDKAVVGKFYRPIKDPVTIRLDVDVIAWLKAEGPGYQTRINFLLRRIMERGPNAICASEEAHVNPNEGAVNLGGPALGSPEFLFPNLEKHRELAKYVALGRLIKERQSIFAPAA